MRRIFLAVAAAVIPVVALAAAPAASAGAATASVALSPSWQSWQQDALQATSSYRGSGQLEMTALPGPVSSTQVTTAKGVITVTQETMIAGPVVMNLSVLGGQQLVVTETNRAVGGLGTILVLAPGTETISKSYPIGGSQGAQDQVAKDKHAVSRLVTIGGCYGFAYSPTVISSIFGLLVQGEGTISCSTSESLSAIVSLYIGATHVGTTAGGTDTGVWLSVNSYAPCYSGGPNTYLTAELWAVNGSLSGTTSPKARLSCHS